MPRTADPITGQLTITGSQCLTGSAGLYDVAGSIRGQLIDLIALVKTRDAPREKPKKKHFRLF